MTDAVKEVRKILNELSSIATYFHNSSVRTVELGKIAADFKLTLLSFPTLFEVRWTEWTYTCVKNILRSWNALVIYFEQHKAEPVANGYLKFFTNYDKLKLITFLADLLQIYKHYHKNVQSDSLTIITLDMHVNALKTAINSLMTLIKMIVLTVAIFI